MPTAQSRMFTFWFSVGYLLIGFTGVALADDSPRSVGRSFTVDGTRIIDPEGRRFVFKGVAAPYGPFAGGMRDWDSGNTYDRDFGLIKDLGCNIVRIFVAFKNASDDVDRAKLIKVVGSARGKGLAVELSVAYTSCDNLMTKGVGGKPSWIAWLASQWKNDPWVWIGPMNEPNGAPPGDRSKLGDWAWWQKEQNAYIAAARDAGNSAPLLIDMPAWSWGFGRIEQFPLTDPLKKIVYCAHRYANENQSFTPAEKAACDRMWGDRSAKYPIVVEEVGGQNDNQVHMEWNRGFMDYCADWVINRHGNGVIAFNWYWCDDNSMTGNWRRNQNTGELNEWGRIFRDHFIERVKEAGAQANPPHPDSAR